MIGFEPGEGWHAQDEADRPDQDVLMLIPGDGSQRTLWVREEPVPALPTEPYTVIRVTWREHWRVPGNRGVLLLWPHPEWRDLFGGSYPARLAERITGFEILAEPPAATAKAVLDRVATTLEGFGVEPRDLTGIADEFGVDS